MKIKEYLLTKLKEEKKKLNLLIKGVKETKESFYEDKLDIEKIKMQIKQEVNKIIPVANYPQKIEVDKAIDSSNYIKMNLIYLNLCLIKKEMESEKE